MFMFTTASCSFWGVFFDGVAARVAAFFLAGADDDPLSFGALDVSLVEPLG